jgi:hypothetical protein
MSWENPAAARETASVSHLHASADQIAQAQVGYNAGQWWSAASDAVSAIHLAACALRAACVTAPDMPALPPPALLTTDADAAAWIAAAKQYHAAASTAVTSATGVGQPPPGSRAAPVRHLIPSNGWSIALQSAARALRTTLQGNPVCGDTSLGAMTRAFQTLFNLESREHVAIDCEYDPATASALAAVLGEAPPALWGQGGRCSGQTPHCKTASISPNAIHFAAGVAMYRPELTNPSAPNTNPVFAAAKDLSDILRRHPACNDAALAQATGAFQRSYNAHWAPLHMPVVYLTVDCEYGPATWSALNNVGYWAGTPLWGAQGPCHGQKANCPPSAISPNAVHFAAGAPTMKQAWQVWEGERVAAIEHLGVGQTVAAEVRGVGAVHFHKHPSGTTLVYGPRGLGALAAQDGGSQTTDPALLAAVQAMLGGDPCSLYMNPAGNPAVRMFQVAWNGTTDSNMGSPALTVDGKYDPNTANAAAQANGSNVPAACKEAPPAPPANQVTCPDGSVHPAGYQCPAAPPPPGGTPTNYLPWVIGAVGVVAVLGVGYAVMSKPTSKDMKAHAKHHDRMAAHHRLHAGHARHVARATAAEESALESHRRRRAREEARRHRARAA